MTHNKRSVRLSTNAIPVRYDITLTPDLQTFTFDGVETIDFRLQKPSRSITLHAKELQITKASILSNGIVQPALISLDDKTETATFSVKKALSKGTAEITIAFRGSLNDKMHGFYRSSYMDGNKKKYLATTQFESTDARRAFPCFDEPAMKAVFDISLNIRKGHVAISNTLPTEITPLAGGRTLVRFGATPRMSTYLLAFIVGEFEHVQRKSPQGTLVRVFTTKGKKPQARFALDCAAKTVDFFNQYFDISYPLPKLDMIAIPDFSAGAMENWGAITYRESALLVDPRRSSTMNKQWVALVIAHEIAHQWFGNLVTMEWWTHLWLNEGFASYIEYLAVDHLFPDWDIWTQFLQSDQGAALHYDGLKHTHPVEIEVHHPSEIASVFDAVSYSKGASLIRMIAEYLGENTFREGLRQYLKRHAYKNTVTNDLWDALQHISGKPIATIMAEWTAKPGYPLLTVKDEGGTLKLSQARFYASSLSGKNGADPTLWHIPVNYATDEKTGTLLIKTQSISIDRPRGAWLKFNANESGFFRTAYPAVMRQNFLEPIKNRRLNTRDRIGLMRDMAAMAETGLVSAAETLSFARNYKSDDEYMVWGVVTGAVGKIASLISREKMDVAFRAYALDLLSEIKTKTSWGGKPQDHSKALLKVLVLEQLGRYGDERTIKEARKRFAVLIGKKGAIPADLRGIVYAIALTHGGSKEHTQLLRLYTSETLHEEKNRIGRALGAAREPELLHKTLDFSLSVHVRPQDSVRMISAVSSNPKGTDLAWGFIKQRWGDLQKRYSGTREISYLLEPLGISTDIRLATDVAIFLKEHPSPGTERTVKQLIERVRSNAAWLARDKKALADFLGGVN